MTDTINTYADPGSDPAHEWQQPALEVTPASLRAHADWMDGDDGQAWEGSRALRLRAARLEAESARDEYWLGIAMDVAKVWHPDGWDECGTDERQRLLEAVSVVEANLAADGRLLPEGGTDLLPCERCNGSGSERLRRNPDTISRVQKAQAERDQAVRVEVTPPAVPVPDSGPWETADAIPADVAEIKDRVGKVWRRKSGGWCFMPGNSCGCVDGILDTHFAPFTRVEEPNSGPDGTPEKPWEAWQDVPEGVSYAGHNDPTGEGGVWRNTPGGRVFQTGLGGAWRHSAISDSSLQGLAPFVRVDGEQK